MLEGYNATTYQGGIERRVNLPHGNKSFNMFLAQDKIIKFERNDGWVTIGKDMLRDMTDLNSYRGSERRCTSDMGV